tara:strand:- start:10685 stop:11365 length:681 start_codon:yes stop_codon:yes gene_type:complete
MKTLVVGDLHGHKKYAELALASEYNVVFIGDYLDSFTESPETQVELLLLVLNAVEENPERVTGLLGNHEMSYLDPNMRASGFNNTTYHLVKNLKDRMLSSLKSYVWVDDVLVSHAGVSQEFLNHKEMSLREYLDKEDFNDIGYYRGGDCPAGGGLYWNDFNTEMLPVPGVTQVVGHSNSKGKYLQDGVRLLKKNDGLVYCVDNLGRSSETVLISKGGIELVELDNL